VQGRDALWHRIEVDPGSALEHIDLHDRIDLPDRDAAVADLIMGAAFSSRSVTFRSVGDRQSDVRPGGQSTASASLFPRSLDRPAKMERISQILQFPIIVERGRALALEPQLLKELDFVLSGIAAEGTVTEEFL